MFISNGVGTSNPVFHYHLKTGVTGIEHFYFLIALAEAGRDSPLLLRAVT